MKYSKIFLVTIVLLYLITEDSFSGEVGGQSGAFLRRGVGSHALAMGSAYTSVANDPSALYWNPAGLSEIKQPELFGMFSVLTLDRQQLFFAFGYNFSDIFSAAIGWNKFGVNNIDGRDINGNPTKRFDNSENSIMLALSKQIGTISIGVTGKYLNHTLFDRSATGFGFDLGVRAQFLDMFSAGLVVQDIGSSLRWNTQSELKEKIPINVRGGLSFQPKFVNGTVAIEISKVGKNDLTFCAGAEYRIMEFFGVRAGFNGENLAFGGMVKPPLNLIDIQIDYAATNDIISDGYVHHISLRIGF